METVKGGSSTGRRRHASSTVLLLWLAGSALACGDASPPNLLLVTIDTLRADHLSSYGYSRPTSPAIDQLAVEGVRFPAAIVQRAATWPSLTSILTSMHPRSHGVRSQGAVLGPDKRTIAEYLSDAGYQTAAFITNMTSTPHRGFEHLETWGLAHRDPSRREKPDVRATAAARAWLRDRAEAPFFVWVHLIGPHDPYAPDPPAPRHFATGYAGELTADRATLVDIYRNRIRLSDEELAHLVSWYDEEVRAVDRRVGELLAEIDEAGLRDDTLVVVTGDHGEELYDHGFYFFHLWSIYESVLRVPLVMRLPDRLPASRVPAGVVQSIDIAPTVFELLGLRPPDSFEGTSLTARIAASDPEIADDPGLAFSELGPEIFSVRSGRWHYIYNPKAFSSPGASERDHGHRGRFRLEKEELYDLESDPREIRNLAAERPERARALRDGLLAWIARGENRAATGTAPAANTRAELEALGYLAPSD